MPITHILEDFSVPVKSQGAARLMSDVVIEDQRLASFEQGYTAGWDDAIEAQKNDQSRMTGKLTQNLQDVSFTYHEALAQMLRSVDPIFQAITETILPEVLRETLEPMILEHLSEMTRKHAEQPVELVVPIGVGSSLRRVLAQDFPVPIHLREDSALVDGQARLRVGLSEQELDSPALLQKVKAAVDAFSFSLLEETSHEQAN